MNIPIPEELTFWERLCGMQIPIVGPRTKGAATSHGEAVKPHDQDQSPAPQASQDQKALDHGLDTKVNTIEDSRTTKETPKTQDSPALVKDKSPDEPTGFPKGIFAWARMFLYRC